MAGSSAFATQIARKTPNLFIYQILARSPTTAIAQSVEQWTLNPRVKGSSPFGGALLFVTTLK